MVEILAVLLLLAITGWLVYLALRRLCTYKWLAMLCAAIIALPLVLMPVWTLMKSRSFQLFDSMVASVPTTEPIVALTLDDGPTAAWTPVALDTLERFDVRATFFLTGAEVRKSPDATRQIIAAGHEIGNHSWSHQRMIFRSWDFVSSEIESTDAAIRALGYEGPLHVRAPYGKRFILLPWYLRRTGRLNIFFDVEPETFLPPDATADQIARYVVDRARPGSIILLHVMYPSRAASREAIPLIIKGMRERGFRFVTVSELLARR